MPLPQHRCLQRLGWWSPLPARGLGSWKEKEDWFRHLEKWGREEEMVDGVGGP